MTSTKKTPTRLIWGIAIIGLLIILIFVGITLNKSCSLLKISSEIQSEQDIFPVLYFEESILSEEYDTHTFLVENENYQELEKHYRTYSKTYPSSIWTKFDGASSMRDEYGQLLSYYNCDGEESYVFDRSLSSIATKEYILIKGESETIIEYNKNEYFFDFLYFDGNYYLFTYAQTKPELSDYNVIRIYKLTKELDYDSTIEIDFSMHDVFPYNFINNSVAIVDKTILFPLKKEGNYYFLKHNSLTSQTELVIAEYGILGIIADTDCFYVVGFTDDDQLVFHTLSPDGISIRKNTIPLPVVVQMSQEDFRFDKILYMTNSEIYCCFMFGQRCCFLSYDVESNEWKSSWIVDIGDSPYFLMDVKYMIKKGGEYFDLFPNWNNSD